MTIPAHSLFSIIVEACEEPHLEMAILSPFFWSNRDGTIILKMHTMQTFTSEFTLCVVDGDWRGYAKIIWHRAEEIVFYADRNNDDDPRFTNALMRLKLGEQLSTARHLEDKLEWDELDDTDIDQTRRYSGEPDGRSSN